MNPDLEEEEGPIIPITPPDIDLKPSIDNELPEQVEEEVKPETIEISNKNIILRHVKPQDSKYWHFKFNDIKHQNQMTNVLQNIQGYRLTVEYGTPINTADITLKMDGETVGKIHLLLCDRRDTRNTDKYYCKLYFYQFKNNKLYQAVKSALVNFFENFRPITPKSISIKKDKKYHISKRHTTHKKRQTKHLKRTNRKNKTRRT